jgi:transcription initiation factor TFIIB
MSRLEALLHAVDKCPRCGKRALVEDPGSGETTCSNCGLVLSQNKVDEGPEWRNSSGEMLERSRTGAPLSITSRDMGLSTVIGRTNRDASGRTISGLSRSDLERLRKWDSRAQARGSIERNLGQALGEIEKMADKLSLPETVKERAAYIYRKALERGLLRGRSIPGIAAASLYAALRGTETPRTLKDLAAVSNLKKKDIARDYRILLREMDLSMPVADAARNVAGIASMVGMSERVKRRAIEIIRQIEQKGVSAGKSPMGLAASALYLAGLLEGEPRTQKELADAAGVTEVTVRNRYKGLRAELGLPTETVEKPQQTA